MDRYEYAIVTAPNVGANDVSVTLPGGVPRKTGASFMDTINGLGAKGWELVTNANDNERALTCLVFKRARRPESDQG